MGFRENLLKKIRINQLADIVLSTLGSVDSGKRIDRNAMRQLLEFGDYEYRRERDLDLYILNDGEILALDNELKIYHTTVQDIGLRKSPTVKEMVSIKNAIKILNDKDVVVSRKEDTVQRIRKELVEALDLSFNADDIDSMVKDGAEALENGYADGVAEILSLFAELLEFQKAPKAFEAAHCHIWGRLDRSKPGEILFGPVVIFGLMHNDLKMIQNPISNLDGERMKHFQQVAKGESRPDLTGEAVWQALSKAVMQKG